MAVVSVQSSAAVAVVVLCAALVLAPVKAQTPTSQELEATVAALRTEVAKLQASPVPHESFEFSGSGDAVIDPFDLAAGTYKVSWACGGNPNFRPTVTLTALDESTGVSLTIDSGEHNPVEQLLDADQSSRMVGEVSCDGTWRVTGSQLH